jgi:lysophospholipid acyltransferase (LPLAT)-like uncharacterized protein
MSRRRRVEVALAAILGGAVLRVLGATWRVQFENPEVLADLKRDGGRVVMAVWHGELLPLAWAHRNRSIAVLISTHSDGEIIARTLRSLGFQSLRGSTSRGGVRVLLEAVRAVERGRDLAFTTDGPRGPRRVSAPGAGVAAAKADVPLIAVGAVVDRAWVMRSWDRFVIPKFFARIRVRYSAPLRAAGTAARDGEALLPAIQGALLSVCGPDPA